MFFLHNDLVFLSSGLYCPLLLPNGDKYEREYQDGGIHGQGTLTFLDGRKYVGEFKGGNFWNGILYDKDGKYKWKYVKGVRQ